MRVCSKDEGRHQALAPQFFILSDPRNDAREVDCFGRPFESQVTCSLCLAMRSLHTIDALADALWLPQTHVVFDNIVIDNQGPVHVGKCNARMMEGAQADLTFSR